MKKLKELYIVLIFMLFSVSVMSVKANDQGGLEFEAPYFIEIESEPFEEELYSDSEVIVDAPEDVFEEKKEFEVVELDPEPDVTLTYLGEFTLTYYCPCRRCNGKWGAIDGFGNPLKWGTVATDPKVIPMHTHLVIDGMDMEFVARDTGSGVKGKHIDIFVPVSHSEALKMGQGERKNVWRKES